MLLLCFVFKDSVQVLVSGGKNPMFKYIRDNLDFYIFLSRLMEAKFHIVKFDNAQDWEKYQEEGTAYLEERLLKSEVRI